LTVVQSGNGRVLLGQQFIQIEDVFYNPYQIPRLVFQDGVNRSTSPSQPDYPGVVFYYGDPDNVSIAPAPPALALALSGVAAAGLFRLARRLRMVTANC
jgi:hypothetical protein